MMTKKKHSVSHAACTSTDTIFFNSQKQTFSPNCAIEFLGLRSCSSQFARLPRSPSLILFMTCAAKRQSQLSSGLSSAMRTVVCCSNEIQGLLHCRFTSRTAIALRNQFNSSTSLNYRSWSGFMLGPLSQNKMILQ